MRQSSLPRTSRAFVQSRPVASMIFWRPLLLQASTLSDQTMRRNATANSNSRPCSHGFSAQYYTVVQNLVRWPAKVVNRGRLGREKFNEMRGAVLLPLAFRFMSFREQSIMAQYAFCQSRYYQRFDRHLKDHSRPQRQFVGRLHRQLCWTPRKSQHWRFLQVVPSVSGPDFSALPAPNAHRIRPV